MWSLHYDCCTECKTTAIKHLARGLCSNCYNKQYWTAHHNSTNRTVSWARQYDCCTECKTTERKHHSGGLCVTCYERYRRKIWSALRIKEKPLRTLEEPAQDESSCEEYGEYGEGRVVPMEYE